MKVIVGLGNPGKNYEDTRHNVGFKVIDHLSKSLSISLDSQKFKGIVGMGTVQGEKVFLLKPLTYMNLSGESVRPLLDFYKLTPDDLVVIYDDLDLPAGKIRLRQKGGAGGHNGIKSMIQHLGTQEFNRVRIGIDRPKNGMAITDYVLGKFTDEESTDIDKSIEDASKACEKWITDPFLEVMNVFNQS